MVSSTSTSAQTTTSSLAAPPVGRVIGSPIGDPTVIVSILIILIIAGYVAYGRFGKKNLPKDTYWKLKRG
jgi:hypothetical protein